MDLRYNRLETQSNTIRLNGSAGIESHTGWRILVDGNEVAECAQPFRADEPDIELESCGACGIPGCGGGWISARRVFNAVLWTRPFDPPVSGGSHGMKPGQFYLFEPNEYQHIVGSGEITNLEKLDLKDTRRLMGELLHPLRDALYVNGLDIEPGRVPTFGKALAEACSEGIEGIVDEMPLGPLRTIEIGLDLPKVPECKLLLGSGSDAGAVLFVDRPQFPLWLRSSRLAKLVSTGR